MFSAIALVLAQAPAAVPMPDLDAAQERIAARDAELFWYAFEGCDANEVRTRISDDFRMLHDLGGLVAKDGDAFTAMIADGCEARAEGGRNEGYKNRRQLVPGTDTITPLGDWGMLHRGQHTFHEWRGEERGWVMTGGARFINIWQWDGANDRFVIQETISIDHGGARPYPPER